MKDKELIDPMEFLKIDKLSDELYSIAPNLVLKFNVGLSRISKDGKRSHFHREYEYKNRNINEPLVTIKRSFDYYVSIESQSSMDGDKVFIRIGPQEYLMVKSVLEEVISWFNDKKYSKLYMKDHGKLVMLEPIPTAIASPLPQNKYIKFYPTIIDIGMANDDKEPGITIELSPSYKVDLLIDRFMGLFYIFSSINMYQSAVELINYLERPELGTNRFVMGDNSFGIRDREYSPTPSINGRQIPGSLKKLEDLENG